MTRPLGSIALCFSGGGSRAAGFHLGTLTYLDRLDILKDVAILSTVSGGTFVGASYALALKEAPPGEDLHVTFQRYLKSFRDVLITSRLLPWALQRMADGRVKVPSGRVNLVTALAQVYDDTFLHHASFGVFWNEREIHLKELIFNATEFETGMAFRFQKGEHSRPNGSARAPVSEAHARKMRLADVVASSSCIPVGLEPLMFPDDFRWPADEPGLCAAIKAELLKASAVDAVPIMDGGVYDNQGIESALMAVRPDTSPAPREAPRQGAGFASLVDRFRTLLESPDELGTLIVSDAPLDSGNTMAAEAPPHKKGIITLHHVDIATQVAIAFSCLTIVYLIAHLVFSDERIQVFTQVDDFFVYAMPMALAASLALLLRLVRRTVRGYVNEFPQTGHQSWADIRRLKVAQVVDMVRLRLSSTWALTSWVSFNRIRQLGYNELFSLPAGRRHLMSHEIDDLLAGETIDDLPDWLKPSSAATTLAQRASTLGTKLWFDSVQELDDVASCGRMTMCFNILTHLERHYPVRSAAQQATYDLARADWAILQADPFAPLPARSNQD